MSAGTPELLLSLGTYEGSLLVYKYSISHGFLKKWFSDKYPASSPVRHILYDSQSLYAIGGQQQIYKYNFHKKTTQAIFDTQGYQIQRLWQDKSGQLLLYGNKNSDIYFFSI